MIGTCQKSVSYRKSRRQIISLGANLHVTAESSAKRTILNVNEIFDDAQGDMSKEYSTDGSHILGKYFADWVQWILDKTAKDIELP